MLKLQYDLTLLHFGPKSVTEGHNLDVGKGRYHAFAGYFMWLETSCSVVKPMSKDGVLYLHTL